MSRNGKIIFGIVTIIIAFVSSGIGLWGFSFLPEHNYVMTFILMSTPGITTLAIINLLRQEC
ncbi:MAG: hypothetical protein PHC41_10290 [Lachnospiraceae bacterium]|nr:hypothetical protein [Lachnospiraceae bacterium]MDD3616599.1 hypothetical protein [Lachnospiraceae bacterium]